MRPPARSTRCTRGSTASIPITGKRYDALDPELLLYVHACLVDSALLFEELTVGALDDEGRERFHGSRCWRPSSAWSLAR